MYRDDTFDYSDVDQVQAGVTYRVPASRPLQEDCAQNERHSY